MSGSDPTQNLPWDAVLSVNHVLHVVTLLTIVFAFVYKYRITSNKVDQLF